MPDDGKAALYAIRTLIEALHADGKLPVDALLSAIEREDMYARVSNQPEDVDIRYGMWWLRDCVSHDQPGRSLAFPPDHFD